MQNLNVPTTSDSTSVTTGRKRQRSTSLNSATSSSSPKRAASEDNTFSSLDTSTATITSSALDLDTHMSDLTNPPSIGTSESPTRATDPASRKERLERIRELCKEPLRDGDTWFLVSRTWYRRWERAMSDTADEKEESVSEADLGPVNNMTLIDPDGELKTNLIEGVDVEFVPVDAWNLFTEWYGESPNPLSRKVVSRGTVTNQCILEIYPPRFRIFRVTDDPFKTETSGAVEFHIQSTQARRIRDFIRDLAGTVSPGNTAECRVWSVEASGLSGGEWPSGKIMAANDASTLDESDDTLNDTVIMSGDAFAVEFKKNGKWIVNRPDPAKDDTTQPVFSEGSDFFSTNRFKPVTGPKPQSMGHQTLFKPASAMAKPTKSFPPGTLGLGNLGNTCFMNSAIQCLAHTRELADYFLTNVFSKELNPDNPLGMGGAIAESFGSLLRRIWAPTTTSYSPRDFKQVLARFAPQFSGYQQHDSQELVAFLLDGLHEDLNRVLKKPYVEKPDWEGGGDLELVKLAKDSWDGYMKRNDSVIVDLFQSQYRSTLICPECNKVSITFDPFMYLTLPLPVHKKWRHEIYFIPSDPLKPHTKVPIEITGDASFKEVRQLLGRWLETNPDHLMVMEVFAQKFYKSLNDSVLVSDMQDGDMIVCYELDGPTHQARNAKRSDSDPLLVPVLLADINPPRFSSFSRSQPQNFGWPLMLALTQDDMRSVERIQERVVEQLSRWTRYSRDLWSWQSTDEPMGEDEVQISFPDAVADAVTEIKENGDIVIQEPVLEVEEGDIVDEKGMILDEPAETLAKGDGGDAIRRLGVKKEIFTMRLQASTKDFGSGYAPTYTKYEEWDDRRQEAAADQLVDDPILLRADDMIVLEFEGNMKDFYFGDEGALFKAWQEFRHPEYEEAERAAKTQTKRGITLQDCLDEFTKEEQLGEDDLWYCPNCKKHQQATKKFDIWGVPDVLVVHLKRFSNSRALRDKIDTFVDFPTEGLDLTDMAQERKVARNLRDQGVDVAALGFDGDLDEPLLYDLFAVDEHLGGLGGGHYRAHSYNPGTEKWHHFDDSFVTEARPEDAINANAYLLFYRRRTSRPLGGKTHTMIEEARVLAQSETPVTTGDSTPDTAPVTTAASTPAQLPTPPNEPAPPALPQRSGEFRSTRWMSTTVSSPSSSPPPLGELDDELPNFEDSQLDEVLGPAYQTMGYGSSKASPSSSVEAELDDSADDEAQERPGWERLVATDDDLDAELGALFGNNDEKKTSLYPSSLWKPVTSSGPLRTVALPNEDASTDGAREGILTPPPESQSQSPSHSSESGLGLSL